MGALGSDALGYGGAGALACIIAAFVASYGWRKQGWSSKVSAQYQKVDIVYICSRHAVN